MAAITRFLLLGLCLVSGVTWAQQVDLYTYQTLVSNQERPERNQATTDGLAEVLIRASGQPSVLQDSGVRQALSNPWEYLVEYRYEATDETLTLEEEEVPAWRLVLKFSGDAVQQLLRRLQLPIWPANRPEVLTWLVLDDYEGGRRVMADQPDAEAALENAARQRGLPLILPLMDLEDQVAVSAQAFWSLDEEAIRKASARYQPDAILVGRLTQTSSGRWRGGWLLLTEQGSEAFDSRGQSLADLAADGINQTADYFFNLYGYRPGSGASRNIYFQVGGVNNFATYRDLIRYLSNLAAVQQVDVSVVLDHYVLLTVNTEADVQLLREALALDDTLIPEPGTDRVELGAGVNPTPAGSADNPLKYQWR